MSPRLAVLLVVTAAFGALTAKALVDVGVWGIFEPHFTTWGGAQVFADLVILALLSCFWMAADARRRGTSALPFVLLTLAIGSFGPLLYLIVREVRSPGAEA